MVSINANIRTDGVLEDLEVDSEVPELTGVSAHVRTPLPSLRSHYWHSHYQANENTQVASVRYSNSCVIFLCSFLFCRTVSVAIVHDNQTGCFAIRQQHSSGRSTCSSSWKFHFDVERKFSLCKWTIINHSPKKEKNVWKKHDSYESHSFVTHSATFSPIHCPTRSLSLIHRHSLTYQLIASVHVTCYSLN